MNTILLVYSDTELKRITWYSEKEKDVAWTEFKNELKTAFSDTTVELMRESEFLKRISPAFGTIYSAIPYNIESVVLPDFAREEIANEVLKSIKPQ